MKKCCFVKFLRKHTPDGFLYEVVKDIQPNDDHSELVSSLTIYNKIDLIRFDDIDSNTNLIITIDVVDVTDLFLIKLKLFIDSINIDNFLPKLIRSIKKEGLNVHAAAEGFISRIKISTFGYGKAIYITHPNGFTTVYGHLSSLSSKIDTYLKAEQYKLKSFEVDLYLKPTDILISKNEIVALSGNTGGSDGPHLHFEFRIGGRHVDPLTLAQQGSAEPISEAKRPQFNQRAQYARTQLMAAAQMRQGNVQ